jgi:hypothetical protein
MKIFNNTSVNTTKAAASSLYLDVSEELFGDQLVASSRTDKTKIRKVHSVKFMNWIEPYTIMGVRYSLFYTEVDHNLSIGDKVFIVGGNYDSDTLIQQNKFNKLSDGYKVLYVDKTKVVLDIEYTGLMPWEVDDDDDFIKIFVASNQEEFEYLIQQSSARDSYKNLSNKFASKNSHSNNTFLYIDGTFQLSGNDYGVLGFTHSGNSYTTYSNSFFIYDQFGVSQSTAGYLQDITSDLLSGSYSSYLSTNLHPRISNSDFVSRDYIIANQREITGSAIPKVITTGIFLRTDNPHNITIQTILTLENLEGPGTSYFNGNSYNFFPGGDSHTLFAITPGLHPATFTGGMITKPTVNSADESIYNNGKIKIFGSDFTKSGIEFKNGYVYKFDGTTWKADITYLRPYITTHNFRNGNFKSGKFNQGLIGTHLKKINYNGSDVNFTLGTVLNVNWIKGNLGSISSKNTSYFTEFDTYGLPVTKVNSANNGGFGYNYIDDTNITESNISNGLFNNNIIGSASTNVAVEDFLKNSTVQYSINTTGGSYYNTEFNNSNIRNSTLISSNIYNSVVNTSKSVNSDFESSVFYDSKYTSDKIIKILGYEEKFLNWWDKNLWKPFKLYKFYFDKKYISRLVNFQNFYIDGLDITKPGTELLHFFDDKFSLDSYKSSYDTNTAKRLKRVIAQISYGADNNSTLYNDSNFLTQSSKFSGLASIDIFISATPIENIEDFNTRKDTQFFGTYKFDLISLTSSSSWESATSDFELEYSGNLATFSATPSMVNILNSLNTFNIGTWTYSGYVLEVDGTYEYGRLTLFDSIDSTSYDVFPYRNSRQVITETYTDLNITNAYIIDSDFKSGLFKNSTWVSGNYINYNQDHQIVIDNNSDRFSGTVDTTSTPKLIIPIGSKNRRRLVKQNEMVFLNGIYYDTTITGGEYLVKLPDTLKINLLSEYSTATIQLEDTINGTSSVLYYVPNSTTASQKVLVTKHAQHAYNYAHPVKFEGSLIQSGIFRRGYFQNCTLDNFNLNLREKNPQNFNNWRNLVVSENIFIDNQNLVKSAVVYNSSVVSGTDNWQNGILYNSIWNVESFSYSFSLGTTPSLNYFTTVNKFSDGIVKNSRWVNGIFGGGLFYKNASNTPFTSSVYSESVQSNWRNRNSGGQGFTRYSWLGGTFERGNFELSNFENGTILDANFYNSTMLSGISKRTNFGRANLLFSLTKVGSGTFSDVNVISAEFRSQNPNGEISGNWNIDWQSGVFNSGDFGVKVDSASYSEMKQNYGFNSTWYGGTFENGNFMDIASWQNGKFNNGKFTSYYGYPHIVAASYSTAGSQSFAWQNGEFNGGEFGNGSTGSNSTWYEGEFNGGIFRGRYWNNGIFTRGFFYGSGLNTTSLDKVPLFVSGFSDDFYGLWNTGWVHEVKDNFVKQKRIFTKLEREFTRKKKNLNTEFKNVLWRSGTFSHNNAQMTESVWLDGVFERGKFYKSSFNPYVNYLVNGYFKDDDGSILPYYNVSNSDYVDNVESYNSVSIEEANRFLGDTAKKLIFTGTSSIANFSQTAGLIVGEQYELKALVDENYNTEIRLGSSVNTLRNRNFTEDAYWILAATSVSLADMPIFTIATGSPGHVLFTENFTADSICYLIYPDALEIGRDYVIRFYTFDETSFTMPYVGSCDSDQITYDTGVLLTDFTVGTNYTYSVPSGSSNFYFSTLTAEYSDLIFEIRGGVVGSSFKMTSLIVSGNDKILNTSDISSKKLLNYSFNADDPDFSIEFIAKHTANSSAPPTINFATSSIISLELIKGSSGFNLSDNCKWDGGTFEDSEFYISKWNNGKWISGTAIGMIWKNGVANYMNAYNIYWRGGVWRNGNWNGSPFSYENINPNGCFNTYISTNPQGLTSPWNNLDLSGSPNNGYGLYNFNTTGTMSFIYSASDGTNPLNDLATTYHDPELDPDASGNFIDTNGLPFIKSSLSDYTVGTRYKVTINIGTVSIPNQQDADNVGFLFSLGKPSQENIAYGKNSGIYEGSIYPDAISFVGADFISNYYEIKELDGHVGSIVPDLEILGQDGYLATYGGSVTEILETDFDGRFYFHLNAYGVKDLYVDQITIEEEECELRPEVNDGYVSDILTNVALYRQDISDIGYQEVFINDAFNVIEDTNFPNIFGTPPIVVGSFTQSIPNPLPSVPPLSRIWTYETSYTNLQLTSGSPCSGIFWDNTSRQSPTWPPTIQKNHYRVSAYTVRSQQIFGQTSKPIYAVNSNLSALIFTQSGSYEVTIDYRMHYGSLDENFYNAAGQQYGNAGITIQPPGLQNVSYSNGRVDAFGKVEVTINNVVSVTREIIPCYTVGCNGRNWYGQTSKTFTFDFERQPNDPLTLNYTTIKIRQLADDPYVTLHILGIEVKAKSSQYDPVYNNATYSMFSLQPSYSDTLLLPVIDTIGGYRSNNLIATRFGNGIFTSGTASSFSSIWENGVWNEGLRYDNWIYAFSDLGVFNSTSKPLTFTGELDLQNPRSGTIASDLDRNLTKINPSSNNYIIALNRIQGLVQYENIISDQFTNPLSYYFKIGDRVSVGNIIARDQNDKRRVLRDPFTVIRILDDSIYLQITLNFSARRLERDSDLHLIYVSKNIWLNGAFLNGLFKGLWTNGLFKGRPYITRMIDSQWADGRFDGGRFRGLTVSVYLGPSIDSETDRIDYHSALIQNFNFKDNDKFTTGYDHKYSSWIDVNYTTFSTVTIGRDNVTFDEGGLIVASVSYGEVTRTNHYSIPTYDVLSSNSSIRENGKSTITSYSLGYKYKEYINYLEDIGDFNEYYNTSSTNPLGYLRFVNDGFTWSEFGSNKKVAPGTFSFLSNTQDTPFSNENQLEIRTINGFHFGQPVFSSTSVLNNTAVDELGRRRYSYISFDVTLNHIPGNQNSNDSSEYGVIPNDYLGNSYDSNSVNSSVSLQLTVDKGTSILPTGYLNILNRPTLNVQEYFYNKRGLNLTTTFFILNSATPSNIRISNLKVVETDAVPFFLLGTESRINTSVQAPWGSSAPFIDYENSDFSVIDSIVVSETIFQTLENSGSNVTSGGSSGVESLDLSSGNTPIGVIGAPIDNQAQSFQ